MGAPDDPRSVVDPECRVIGTVLGIGRFHPDDRRARK
jgi:hypothetical protein